MARKRNYRRIKDEHGHIIKNIITVDGVDVEVSEEVFLSYSQMERRERYITEEVEPGRLLSLERLLEDGVPLELLGGEQEKSAEYTVFDQMDKMNIDRESQLIFALSNLDPCEKQLIWALYFEGVSAREYACTMVPLPSHSPAMQDHAMGAARRDPRRGEIPGVCASTVQFCRPRPGK